MSKEEEGEGGEVSGDLELLALLLAAAAPY